MPHSVTEQRLILIEDTFTIMMIRYKESSVVIRTIMSVQPEQVIIWAIVVEQAEVNQEENCGFTWYL